LSSALSSSFAKLSAMYKLLLAINEHVYSPEGRRQTNRQIDKQTNNANTISGTKEMPKK